MKLEYFKTCVRTTMQALGQVTSSVEKQELIQLETTLTNLFNYKEQLVLNPNMITTHTTEEMDVDIKKSF